MDLKGSVLFIDTASEACTVGVCAGGRIYSCVLPMERGQADEVLPMVGRVMRDAGLEYAQLGSVVTTLGPGSFTGLRAGLSVAKSFALALDIPIYGLGSFEAMCMSAPELKDFLVVIESKREQFFVRGYGVCGLDPTLMTAQEIAEFVSGFASVDVIGSGQKRLRSEIDLPEGCWREDLQICDPEAILNCFQGGDARFVRDVAPIYMRDADVSVPKNKLRKLIIS